VGAIFISHASADDGFVADLRKRLEELGHEVWVDSRRLHGGAWLTPKRITTKSNDAAYFDSDIDCLRFMSPPLVELQVKQ